VAAFLWIFGALITLIIFFVNAVKPVCTSRSALLVALTFLLFALPLFFGALQEFARRWRTLGEIRHTLVCKALEDCEFGRSDGAYRATVFRLRVRVSLSMCHVCVLLPCFVFLFYCAQPPKSLLLQGPYDNTRKHTHTNAH
jgi:hypothetical protein